MFTANGGSGYVLKPQYLRSRRSHAPSPTTKSYSQSPSKKEKLPSATPGLEQEKHKGDDGGGQTDDKTGKEGDDDQVDEDRGDGNSEDDDEEREGKEEEGLMSPPQLEERI